MSALVEGGKRNTGCDVGEGTNSWTIVLRDECVQTCIYTERYRT